MTEEDEFEIFDRVKKFSLSKNFTYKEYIDYFYKFDINEKVNIICYVIIFKKYNIKNGNLDKLYNFYKILLNKLQYNELNFKEKYIYETITAFLIVSNNYINNELFDKYCNNYLKVSENNFKRQILLIHQDMINTLNRKNNTDYNICYKENNFSNSIAWVNWIDEDKIRNIYYNQNQYLKFFIEKDVKKIDIIKTLSIEILNILHEYKHILQMEWLYKNVDNLSLKYENDLYMTNFKLYRKYHDYFSIEREANEFGFNNYFEHLETYIKNKYLDKSQIDSFLKNRYNIFPKDNKYFLIQYKAISNYLKLCKTLPIKTKKLKELDNIIDNMREKK